MSDTPRTRRKPLSATVLLILLAAALLAGCGGSSKGSSSTSSASAAKTASGARGQFAARSAALRKCLQENGVTLPPRKAGQRGGPFGAGGAAQLPKGVTRAQLQAAFKKCGGGFPPGGRAINRGDAKRRFAKFATCMRNNGVTLPAPNTSGKGPIFDTKGIDTSTAAFKAADAKCARELLPAGAGHPGGPRGTGGAPPQGAQPGAPPPGQ